jgi:hypothetical protein
VADLRLATGAVFTGTFDPNAINFNAAPFQNPTLNGTFSLARTVGQVFLTFASVPEPVAILAAAHGALFGVRIGRRSLG